MNNKCLIYNHIKHQWMVGDKWQARWEQSPWIVLKTFVYRRDFAVPSVPWGLVAKHHSREWFKCFLMVPYHWDYSSFLMYQLDLLDGVMITTLTLNIDNVKLLVNKGLKLMTLHPVSLLLYCWHLHHLILQNMLRHNSINRWPEAYLWYL